MYVNTSLFLATYELRIYDSSDKKNKSANINVSFTNCVVVNCGNCHSEIMIFLSSY